MPLPSRRITPFAVLQLLSQENVLNLIITLYVQQGRLPEPDELLFCDKNTTIEDIELILMIINLLAHYASFSPHIALPLFLKLRSYSSTIDST